MGGFGSGHYYRISKQDTFEEHRRVYIGFLAKQGMLKPGTTSTMSWNRGGETTGSIIVRGGLDMVTFSYTCTMYGGESESIEQEIEIERTPCHYGGSRPWFTCPTCFNRVGVLVGAGRLFKCRKCYQLPYMCQVESKSDRASRRIRKIQTRLGNEEWQNVIDIWFPRPKGMHRKTYNRIVAQANKPIRTLRFEMAAFGLSDWAKLI
jgi:hypothetical protein